jgi:hypothetical protein
VIGDVLDILLDLALVLGAMIVCLLLAVSAAGLWRLLGWVIR